MANMRPTVLTSIQNIFKEIEDIYYLESDHIDARRLRSSLFHKRGLDHLLNMKSEDCPEKIVVQVADLFIDHFLKLTVAHMNTAVTVETMRGFNALISAKAGMKGIEELLQLRPSLEATVAMSDINNELKKLYVEFAPMAQRELGNKGN